MVAAVVEALIARIERDDPSACRVSLAGTLAVRGSARIPKNWPEGWKDEGV